MQHHLRVARPVTHLARSTDTYCRGLGLSIVGSFQNHDGFDGVMLGFGGASYHFEFTHCPTHPVAPTPTAEDLVVFYILDAAVWKTACASMVTAGFKQVASFNPYWEERGHTYEDPDGYRVVLQHDSWSNAARSQGFP